METTLGLNISRTNLLYLTWAVSKTCESLDDFQPVVMSIPEVHPFMIETLEELYDFTGNLCKALSDSQMYYLSTTREDDTRISIYIDNVKVASGRCDEQLIVTTAEVIEKETRDPRRGWGRR